MVMVGIIFIWHRGNISDCKIKSSPFTNLGFRPDPASMPSYNPFHDSQADTCAKVFLISMKALKWLKEFIAISHVKTNAVIPDKKHYFAIMLGLPKLY